ncbi:CBS domain-containing protein [Alkalimarinus coralli]|uniref:CBS domain-containing protein n=1 Tax=Alkalimarinus coralli TaxID=2935863 RepID=UPI00202B5E8F|nr:CBS domain-containing protein [Alkalimarinus coralli]
MQSLKVRDYMTSNVLTLKAEDSVIDALRKLIKAGRSGAPVVDDKGHIVGLLSEIDCLKETLMGGYHQQAGDSVADHMTTEIDSVNADDNILATADLFIKGRRRLPVLENGKLTGIITRCDFGKALLDSIDHPHHGS